MNAKVGLRGGSLIGAVLLATCFAGPASASPREPAALGQLGWRLRRSFDDLAATPRSSHAILSSTSIACGHPVSGTIALGEQFCGRLRTAALQRRALAALAKMRAGMVIYADQEIAPNTFDWQRQAQRPRVAKLSAAPPSVLDF